MEQHILEDLKRELINGFAKKRHPFRYFYLGTIHDDKPRQRTVVMRKMLPDFTVVVFTDSRSKKVSDIQSNSNVSALFYHPKKLMQIRLEGRAELVSDPELLKKHWNNIPENSRKDYITTLAPGADLKNPDHVDYDQTNPNFCILHIIPETIEYLQLKRPNHLRVQFTKRGVKWQGQFLVP
ncbi:MAG: pyridoxamine 5'-phosphate oxidase family protein [Psychroserpens sp.]|nr:pyridoxamine 5'-phosphate oxidase family protein [Psychroserpens sp.]